MGDGGGLEERDELRASRSGQFHFHRFMMSHAISFSVLSPPFSGDQQDHSSRLAPPPVLSHARSSSHWTLQKCETCEYPACSSPSTTRKFCTGVSPSSYVHRADLPEITTHLLVSAHLTCNHHRLSVFRHSSLTRTQRAISCVWPRYVKRLSVPSTERSSEIPSAPSKRVRASGPNRLVRCLFFHP